jgi:hypothetical protein
MNLKAGANSGAGIKSKLIPAENTDQTVGSQAEFGHSALKWVVYSENSGVFVLQNRTRQPVD